MPTGHPRRRLTIKRLRAATRTHKKSAALLPDPERARRTDFYGRPGAGRFGGMKRKSYFCEHINLAYARPA